MGLQTISSIGGRSGSFLKWAGGKTRYADQLVALAPDYSGCYWEPFMGSAAVFFEHLPQQAVLSDANAELVICFQQVAKDPMAIMQLLDEMPNTPEDFAEIRRQSPVTLTELQRAARVIYLNKTSFRGLWRVNKKGEYNVPYGAYDRPYYNIDTMLTASKALSNAVIRHADFKLALEEAKAGDWVYLDPPYIPAGGYSDFKRYTSGQFHETDQQQLADAMTAASNRGVWLTMTNSDTDATREIFHSFNIQRMATRRDINLQASKRQSWDLVITNYEVKDEPQSALF